MPSGRSSPSPPGLWLPPQDVIGLRALNPACDSQAGGILSAEPPARQTAHSVGASRAPPPPQPPRGPGPHAQENFPLSQSPASLRPPASRADTSTVK